MPSMDRQARGSSVRRSRPRRAAARHSHPGNPGAQLRRPERSRRPRSARAASTDPSRPTARPSRDPSRGTWPPLETGPSRRARHASRAAAIASAVRDSQASMTVRIAMRSIRAGPPGTSARATASTASAAPVGRGPQKGAPRGIRRIVRPWGRRNPEAAPAIGKKRRTAALRPASADSRLNRSARASPRLRVPHHRCARRRHGARSR